jgi:hypothetical protein
MSTIEDAFEPLGEIFVPPPVSEKKAQRLFGSFEQSFMDKIAFKEMPWYDNTISTKPLKYEDGPLPPPKPEKKLRNLYESIIDESLIMDDAELLKQVEKEII